MDRKSGPSWRAPALAHAARQHGPPLPLATLRQKFVEQVRVTAGGLPSTYWFLWMGTLVNRLGSFVVPFLAST